MQFRSEHTSEGSLISSGLQVALVLIASLENHLSLDCVLAGENYCCRSGSEDWKEFLSVHLVEMALPVDFKGKSVLITGASTGLGRGLLETLHKQGAVVHALSRNPENFAKLKEDFPDVHSVCVDLADWDATRRAVEECGAVDCLINNAATGVFCPLLNLTPDDIDRVWHVNFKAVLNVTQVVVRGMIDRNSGGCIINVSSIHGKSGQAQAGVYAATKAALDNLTKTMAIEFAPHNIRVVSVNPTWFPSEMTKDVISMFPNGTPEFQQRNLMKRFATVEEIVNTMLFLMSDLCPMINGTSVFIDGGYFA